MCATNPSVGAIQRTGLILAPMELGRPSKTGQWEEAVAEDKFDVLLLPFIALKRRGGLNDGRLWSFPVGAMTSTLQDVASALGLDGFGVST